MATDQRTPPPPTGYGNASLSLTPHPGRGDAPHISSSSLAKSPLAGTQHDYYRAPGTGRLRDQLACINWVDYRRGLTPGPNVRTVKLSPAEYPARPSPPAPRTTWVNLGACARRPPGKAACSELGLDHAGADRGRTGTGGWGNGGFWVGLAACFPGIQCQP